jgi:hypothetical protein
LDINTQIDSNTTTLPEIDHPKKYSQTSELNDAIQQMVLTDTYRIFHSRAAQYKFFSGFFSDHILGYKVSINKNKKAGTLPCVLSDLDRIKLDINSKRNYRKYAVE